MDGASNRRKGRNVLPLLIAHFLFPIVELAENNSALSGQSFEAISVAWRVF